MKRKALKRLSKYLSPNERAKLAAHYYQQKQESKGEYQKKIDELQEGLILAERREYAFYMKIISEIFFVIEPDLQTIYLKLIICNKNLLLLLSVSFYMHEEIINEKILMRAEKIVKQTQDLKKRLLAYTHAVKELEAHYFNGHELVNRNSWMGTYALEEIQIFIENLKLIQELASYKGDQLDIDQSILEENEFDQSLYQQLVDVIRDRAVKDSGYQP